MEIPCINKFILSYLSYLVVVYGEFCGRQKQGLSEKKLEKKNTW